MDANKILQKENIQDILALTPLQKGMLFHYQMNPVSKDYVEQIACRIKGKLEAEDIRKAWQVLVDNYESLRSIYKWRKLKEPVQIILRKYSPPFFIKGAAAVNIESFMREEMEQEIDLSVAPLHCSLYCICPEEYVLILTYHHILWDGWSSSILLQDFKRACMAIQEGKRYQPKSSAQSWKQYIKWIGSQNAEKARDYWENYLNGFEGANKFYESFNIGSEDETGSVNIIIDKKDFQSIHQICRHKHHTIAGWINAAWCILLHRYCMSNDIVFGSTVSGRSKGIPDIESMVGLFINTLPVRVKLEEKLRVCDVVSKIELDIKERIDYETTPLTDMKSDLFDTIVVYENYPMADTKADSVDIEIAAVREETHYTIAIAAKENEGSLDITFKYKKDKISYDAIRRLSNHYKVIMLEMVKCYEANISSIEILNEEEKKLLKKWNTTTREYPRESTIAELFEEKVRECADNVAVSCGDKSISYRELNQKASKLAALLRIKGVGPDSIVGLMTKKSIEMIIGVIAILKAGGAYLPLNPEYPAERISYILENSGAKLLLTEENSFGKVDFSGQIIEINDDVFYNDLSAIPVSNNKAADYAYIIYTSGSTGRPKGVAVGHRALHNFLSALYDQFGGRIGVGDHCLSLTNISFDVSVGEIFFPLIYGARLVIFEDEKTIDSNRLVRILFNEKITFAYIPPTLLKPVYELILASGDTTTLNKLLVGVEPIKDDILQAYKELNKDMQIVNGYGPTEATICATMYKYESHEPQGKNVPIGKPLNNTRIYIIDSNNQLSPIGLPGELCISGDLLSEGYLGKPELTAARFVANPFESGSLMYRTGDLARWSMNISGIPDGNIEFLGRIDNQVKIRGYRIELGEVESVLRKQEGVKEAVVLDHIDNSGIKYLCGYFIKDGETALEVIRNGMRRELPDYMVPGILIEIDRIPITDNGKINKKALLDMAAVQQKVKEYEAPRNDIEVKLAGIWQEILGVERVGINDDFFGLGGHSLKAMTLSGMIQKELGAEIEVRDIFEKSTIRALSEKIGISKIIHHDNLKPLEKKNSYNVSSAQKRLYTLQMLDKESTLYNIPMVLEMDGKIDFDKVKKGIEHIIEKHEVLRTSFHMEDEDIHQVVHEQAAFGLEFIEAEEEEEIQKILKNWIRPFELDKAPLIRGALIKSANKHRLILDMHHIISDGTTLGILSEDFAKAYEGTELKIDPIQYKEYVQWENEQRKNGVWEKQKAYWLKELKGDLPVLELPIDKGRSRQEDNTGECFKFEIGPDVLKGLKDLAARTGGTLYMGLMAGYSILLSKYSGQDDIIIGIPIAGRRNAQLQNIAGMFVNNLAIRIRPDGDKKIADYLTEIKHKLLGAYENQDFPYEELIEALKLSRDPGRNPLFDVMLVLQNTNMKEIKIPEVSIKAYGLESKGSKFDITLSVTEDNDRLLCEIEYRSKRYSRDRITAMAAHYVNILKEIQYKNGAAIKEINWLAVEEQQKVLQQFNNTFVNYEQDKTLIDLFEKQVHKKPESVAIIFENKKLTYRELNEKANQLAWHLRNMGVSSNSIIGIMAERSFEMVIGILAILKAGGAYLPIDPAYPMNRISYMIKDSGIKILLTQSNLAHINTFEGEVIMLDDKGIYTGNVSNIDKVNKPEDLAYIIYTSGTTGLPKGVMIEHCGIYNTMRWRIGEFQLNETDRVLQLFSFAFDGFVVSLFTPLLSGAQVVLLQDWEAKDPLSIKKYIMQQHITYLVTVPSLYMAILTISSDQELKSLSRISLAGENLTQEVVKLSKQKSPLTEIMNEYGPTEASVECTIARNVQPDSIITIGKPISNTSIYILDKHNYPQPVGIPREICISGAGLAKGYLNQPELTAEKFVSNPFAASFSDGVNAQMYHTGDLGRWLSDGSIEFLGRIDHQIKIRGYRIELSEIESAIKRQAGIKEAVVLGREDSEQGKYLCGYIIKENNADITMEEVKEGLRKQLPDYMVPRALVEIEHIPVTSNGKIDGKSLLEIKVSFSKDESYEAPRDEIEIKLVQIWEELLGVERIGIQDNFFELGGHSLKATTLSVRIQKELEAEISVKDVFEEPTIWALAKRIKHKKGKIYDNLSPLEEKGSYPVSSAQKRLYAIQMMDMESKLYNMPLVLELTGMVDVVKIQKAINALIEKHEALRTSFHMHGEEIVQKIHKKADFKLEYEEIADEVLDRVIDSWIKPFELDKAPLLRGGIIRDGERYFLVLDMHHIISDGTTMGILAEDFVKFYEGELPKPEPVQYKEYAQWEKEQKEKGSWENQRDYWKKEYEGEIPVLELPTEGIRGKLEDIEGNTIRFCIEEETVKNIKQSIAAIGGSLYMALMAGYSILLSKYSGQQDIVIGSPVAGRRHAQMTKVAGMFVNTLAIRTRPEGEKKIGDFLVEMKQKLLEAYENQEYPYEELVEEVKVKRDLSRNPLFDVMLVLQNTEMKVMHLNNVQIRPYIIENKRAQFEITLTLLEENDKLCCEIEYRSRLYSEHFIRRMIKHYIKILNQLGLNKERTIKEIELLEEDEKQLLLKHFNAARVVYGSEETVVDLIEGKAMLTPQKTAVVYGNKELTYGQLKKYSDILAIKLRKSGIGPECIVAVISDADINYIVAIMGILKAGAAFLPILLEYPKERIQYILKDSQAPCLIINGNLDIEGYSGTVIDMADSYTNVDGEEAENINESRGHYSAYILYTSGSTGQPKGVVIEHKSLTNQVIGLIEDYGYGKMEHQMLYSKPIFDVSVQHIFTALSSGAVLHLMDDKLKSDYGALYTYIKQNKVEFIDMVPAQMEEMSEHLENNLENIRLVLGGEAFSPSLYQKLLRSVKPEEIYNVYGPTETTINALIYRCKGNEKGRVIPIGRPVRNYLVYILDQYGQLQPIGIPGELCISGEGLARGYLNQPELTAEKFIQNPFEKLTDMESSGRMYRTGDLVRWAVGDDGKADGSIEFLGRLDQQVKIRGYRIELGEIENVLIKQTGVKEAVVLDREDGTGSKYLCAYIVKESEIDISDIREGMRKELPEYMVPGAIIEIDKIPLTHNGKIDRKMLLSLDALIPTGIKYVEPRNETEAKLAQIWADILGIHQVGIYDDFFELGGHSLKATILAGRIRKELDIEIGLKDIFERPNIAALVEVVRQSQKQEYDWIYPLEKMDSYATSSAQKRQYAIQMMDKQSILYNMPLVLELTGDVIVSRLEKAIAAIVQKHEALRTSFHLQGEEIVQKVHAQVTIKLDYMEAANKSEAERIVSNWIKPFELDKVPLMRSGIVKVDNSYLLFWDMHHIISDGTTTGILVEDFIQAYEGAQLKAEPVQYKEFAQWEKLQKEKGNWEKQKAYWKKELEGELPVLELPTIKMRTKWHNNEGDNITFEINEEILSNLKNVVREAGATMYMALMAGYGILLSKYSGQKDIIIGSPIAGRSHAQIEKVAGMFVNTLAIRTQPEDMKTIKTYLIEVKHKLLNAYENQEYPYDELVEELSIKRDPSRNPLFDTMLVLQNAEMKEITLSGVTIKPLAANSKKAKFDITLNIEEVNGKLICEVEYRSKLYCRDIITQMVKHYISVIQEIGDGHDKAIKDICWLDTKEKLQLLEQFNPAQCEAISEKNIVKLFEDQAVKTPKNIALVMGDKELTYEQVNTRANQLARKLIENGVQPKSIVGILLERSIDMVISIFAVLKAGGAYLPLDTAYPKDRIEFMLEDSGSKDLISMKQYVEGLKYHGYIWHVEAEEEKAKDKNCENLAINISSRDLAYIIYTSGSTGKPKGVMIEHISAVNTLLAMHKYYPLLDTDAYLLKTAYTFDVSVAELFGWFIEGGRLAILEKGAEKEPDKIFRAIKDYKITHINFVPSMLGVFVDMLEQKNIKEISTLKYIFAAGEALPMELVNKFLSFGRDIRLENIYGPTEAAIYTTKYSVADLDERINIPIGKPIQNTRVYVLDEYNKLQPIWVAGELCISGIGLARGYLNNAGLTSEKFVPNPYTSTHEDISTSRIYKTGDLVRWMPDGNIEFLGRIDHQVKIRGYRVELGEIENILCKQAGVKQAVVIDRQDEQGSKFLCAYIVKEKAVDIESIRSAIKKDLPEYMIPGILAEVENIPLTTSGKVNRKALSEIAVTPLSDKEYEAPKNEIQVQLVKLWQEILSLNAVGIQENFFELGGHSIKAIKLLAKIHQEMNIKLDYQTFYENSSIKALADFIQANEGGLSQHIQPVESKEYYETSYVQKRMWLLNQINPNDTSYNMPGRIEINDENPVDAIEEVLNILVMRHESLRTCFIEQDEDIYQRIEPYQRQKLDVQDLSALPLEEAKEEVQKIVKQNAEHIFNLSKTPLFKLTCIKLEKGNFEIVFCMHHIISDGWSVGIIQKEFMELYNLYKNKQEISSKPLVIQYKDFAHWQNQMIKNKSKTALEYWQSKLNDYPEQLRLPEQINLGNKGQDGHLSVLLEGNLFDALNKMIMEKHTGMFSLFLSSLYVFLYRLTGQTDIVMGTAVSGREHYETESIIGCFVNTLLLREKLVREESFEELLKKVSKNISRALTYQTYPLELVLEKAGLQYPDIQVFLNLLNIADGNSINEHHSGQPVHTSAKFDIVFYVIPSAKDIRLICEYKRSKFSDNDISFMFDRYLKTIEEAVYNVQRPIMEFGNEKRKKLGTKNR